MWSSLHTCSNKPLPEPAVVYIVSYIAGTVPCVCVCMNILFVYRILFGNLLFTTHNVLE